MPKKVVKKQKSKKIAKPAKPLKSFGAVTHYYSGIKVGIFKFKKPVKLGTEIHIKGATTDFKTKISGMQYSHNEIKVAPKGKQIGIKIKKRVRAGDQIYPV